MLATDPGSGLPKKKRSKTPYLGGPGFTVIPEYGGVSQPSVLYPAPAAAPTGDSQVVGPSAGAQVGGTNVDLASILANDPMYQQFLADLQASSVADRSSLKAARQRALIQFGGNPNLSAASALLGGDFSQDITPEILAAAAAADKSGVSTTARLGAAHEDALRQIRNSLAARGMTHSGANAWNVGREGRQYSIASYDATQKLIDYLANANSSAAQAARERQLLKAQQERQVLADWLASHPDASGFGTGGQTPVPAQDFSGQPLPDWQTARQQYGYGYGGL